MCGEIKLDNWSRKSPITLGSFLPEEAEVLIAKKEGSLQADKIPGNLVRWNGFAREETLRAKFSRTLWKRGEIVADGFKEKGLKYDLPQGHSIQGVILKTRDTYHFNVITRQARGEEILVAERWPKTGKRRFVSQDGRSTGNGTGKEKAEELVEERNLVRVGITGHRPKSMLKGNIYDWRNEGAVKAREWMAKELLKIKKEAEEQDKQVMAMSGMALGVDLWFAAVCVKLNIPFIASLPCKNQDKLWGKEYRELYKKALQRAYQVIYVSKEEYSGPECMLNRNIAMAEWLAKDSNSILLSVHNGKKGGTSHMRSQAKKLEVKNINFDPNKETK